MRFPTLLAFLFVGSAAQVQASELDRIVVTGSLLDTYGLPAVNLERPADFLAQSVRVINDSRAPELRKQEILATLERLQRAARQLGGVELSVGVDFLSPLRLDPESLELKDDGKRADTSFLDVYIERRFDPQKSAEDQIRELQDYIRSAAVEGRTILEPDGEIALTLLKPERYRPEILAAIASELARIREQFPASCQLRVSGLGNRVEWMRVGTAKLALYISHEIGVDSCRD